jgi:hypothetical protein
MSDSNSSKPSSGRPTLKLKTAKRKAPTETKTSPAPHTQNNSKSKPDSHWSDELKEGMQADMDKLVR